MFGSSLSQRQFRHFQLNQKTMMVLPVVLAVGGGKQRKQDLFLKSNVLIERFSDFWEKIPAVIAIFVDQHPGTLLKSPDCLRDQAAIVIDIFHS